MLSRYSLSYFFHECLKFTCIHLEKKKFLFRGAFISLPKIIVIFLIVVFFVLFILYFVILSYFFFYLLMSVTVMHCWKFSNIFFSWRKYINQKNMNVCCLPFFRWASRFDKPFPLPVFCEKKRTSFSLLDKTFSTLGDFLQACTAVHFLLMGRGWGRERQKCISAKKLSVVTNEC